MGNQHSSHPIVAIIQDIQQELRFNKGGGISQPIIQDDSLSKYKDMVILKGGMFIASLVGISSRTTMDMDATLRGYLFSEETIREALSEICAMQLDDEVTLIFDRVAPIRKDDEYGGYRVTLIAKLNRLLLH